MKNSIFVFMIFFIVSLFISLGANSLESAYMNNLQINGMLSNDAITFKIENAEKISGKRFLDIIEKEKNIYVQKDALTLGIYAGKAVYFNNSKINVPLTYGRFFDEDDFKSNNKVMVIGKNLIDSTFKIGSDDYIKYNQEHYKVIGILGFKDKTSLFDDMFYINLNSILNKYDNLSSLSNLWVLDNKKSAPAETLKKLNGRIKINVKNVTLKQTYEETSKSSIGQIIQTKAFSIILLVAVVLVLLLNIVNTTLYYVQGKRMEIGIRKVLGASNLKIIFNIILDYEKSAFLAFVTSFFGYYVILKLKLFPIIFGESIYLKSTTAAFLICLFIGMIISLIPVKASLKLEANEIMRGK